MVVVAVVASVFTAGASMALLSGASLAAAGSAGLAAVTGGLAAVAASVGPAAFIGGSLIGGAVGSAASQLVGKSMGVVDKFSWKQVAVGALTGGAAAGLGVAANGVFGATAEGVAKAITSSSNFGYASYGAFSYASNQLISRIAGLNTSFSWRGVAASIISANISGNLGAGQARYAGTFAEFAKASLIDQGASLISATLQDKWLKGDTPDYGQVAIDAFGNTLADFIRRPTNNSEPADSELLLADTRGEKYLRMSPLDREQLISDEGVYDMNGLPPSMTLAVSRETDPWFELDTTGMKFKSVLNVDEMGQPYEGPSNYDAFSQFGKILSESTSSSPFTTLGKIYRWGMYTVPDRERVRNKIWGEAPGLAELDQLRNSPLGAGLYAGAAAFGGGAEARQVMLSLGTILDAGASFRSGGLNYMGAQRRIKIHGELVDRDISTEAYNKIAEAEYSKIRARYMTDVSAFSENTGLSISEATTLKKHIFFGSHRYPVNSDTIVRERFEADHEVAYMWNRAVKGNLSDAQKAWIRQLANHELSERSLMAKGVPYLRQEAWKDGRFTGTPAGAHDLAEKPPSGNFEGYDPGTNF